MRKPLYNIVIFIFHIITLILLFTLHRLTRAHSPLLCAMDK